MTAGDARVSRNARMVEVVCDAPGAKEQHHFLLYLDNKASFAAASRPGMEKLAGMDFYNALRYSGAVLHDARDVQDRVIPAERCVDMETGYTTFLAHHQAGQIQDPPSGLPAMQSFDPATGHRIYLAYYRAGQQQDPAPGVPAVQRFDTQGTSLLGAVSFDKGVKHELTPAEIADFLAHGSYLKTQQAPPLPRNIERCTRRGLSPL